MELRMAVHCGASARIALVLIVLACCRTAAAFLTAAPGIWLQTRGDAAMSGRQKSARFTCQRVALPALRMAGSSDENEGDAKTEALMDVMAEDDEDEPARCARKRLFFVIALTIN